MATIASFARGARAPLFALLVLAGGGGIPRPAVAQGNASLPHVRNAATPSGGMQKIQLQERWRAGGENDEVLFGVIGQVLADDQGRLYLLDSQLNQVHVYSPDGTFLSALAGEGDGPGEIRGASDMFFLANRRLALLQTFPGKAVFLGLDGNPAGGFSFGSADPGQGSFGVLVTGRGSGSHLLVGGMRMSFNAQGRSDQTYFLASIDEQGTELARYAEKANVIDYNNLVASEEGFDFAWSRYDLAPDGRVFLAPDREAYRIEVRRPDGTPERVIEREYAYRSRTGAEKDEARKVVQALARNYPVPPRDIVVFDTEPVITAMHCRPDGELWVRTSKGDGERGPGVLTVFDVFDRDGRFQRQIALLASGDPRQDAIYLVAGNRVVVVTQALASYQAMQGVVAEEGAEGSSVPMEVICYDLPAR